MYKFCTIILFHFSFLDKKEKKNFLFLLGRPKSNWNNDTEKRIVSPKVQKTGPACALEMTMWYNEINGARIEFGIQTKIVHYLIRYISPLR